MSGTAPAGKYRDGYICDLSPRGPPRMVGWACMGIEGTLHIVRFDEDPTSSAYSVTFAPYVSHGGALPQLRLSSSEALRGFLLEIGVPPETVNRVLVELTGKGSVSLQHTVLSSEQLRYYKLLELGIGESIMRYLSV